MGTYGGTSAGLVLWPLFGTTNQLLASLVFALITIYLLQRKRPTWPTTIPMLLVSITTIAAMMWNIKGYVRDGNWLLTVIGGIILCAGFVLISLSYKAYTRERITHGYRSLKGQKMFSLRTKEERYGLALVLLFIVSRTHLLTAGRYLPRHTPIVCQAVS